MKKINAFLCVSIALLGLSLNASAKLTNWTGRGSGLFGGTDVYNWYNASNWSNGVPATGDDAQIGVTTSFSNSPLIETTSATIKSLTFGTLSSGSLTINSGVTLTVTGDIKLLYNNGNSPVVIDINGQKVSGVLGGTISCGGSFIVGDDNPPTTPVLSLLGANVTNNIVVNMAIGNFTVGGDVILNTTSASGILSLKPTSNVNNPTINLNDGNFTIGSAIKMTNSLYANAAPFSIVILVTVNFPEAKNKAQFLMTRATGTNAVLSIGASTPLDINADGNGAGFVDFYGAGTNTGKNTVIYSGSGSQTVYTASSGLDASPSVYQNIGFSGTGIKTIQSGNLPIPGNWSSAGGKVNTTSANVSFTGADQTLSDAGSDSGNGIIFPNVTFQGTGTKTLSSGKFSVASTGVLTMAGSAALAANGNLTLLSTETSSATVGILPSGTAITGNVNVQRFFKGSSTDLSKRGYRLISSPVYTGTPGSVRSFDLNYILNDAFVSGAAGGGFNAPTGNNPTLYIYREDIAPTSNSFTSGNFKGISKINNSNSYDIGTQKRLTVTNVTDTTVNLPAGNGVLFFFRGNKTDNGTQTGTKVTLPYDFPEDVTFTQTGQLNTGTVNVKLWFASNNNLSFTNSSSLNNSNTRGYTLVGNPYAATINWEKFNRNGSSSAIYGGGFPDAATTPAKIWVFNPSSKQYDTYVQKQNPASAADTTTEVNPTGSLYTGAASNMIASGQGFFIRTTTTGQTLSFREQAKTAVQPASANIIKLMSLPGAKELSASATQTNNAPVQPKAILRFKLIKDDINTDEVILAFNNKSDLKFSDIDDVEDLNGNGALVSLSLLSSDNVGTAIKQLQLPQTKQQTINLLADATTTGIYQLTLQQVTSLAPEYEVWLMDSFIKDSLDIRNHNIYNFNIYKDKPASFGANRFKIVIRQNKALLMRALSFTAIKTTSGSQLAWKTENEKDDHVFYIQRSINNGNTFEQIGQLTSSGDGNYSFLDAKPVTGQNHYKVKIQHTTDGAISYSGTVKLMYADTVDHTPVITLYPNPAVNLINIKMPATANTGLYTLTILNSSGKVVKQLVTAQPTWQENVNALLPGTYIVQVINNGDSKIVAKSKFVKL